MVLVGDAEGVCGNGRSTRNPNEKPAQPIPDNR